MLLTKRGEIRAIKSKMLRLTLPRKKRDSVVSGYKVARGGCHYVRIQADDGKANDRNSENTKAGTQN
jgi:hypothetical protein